MTGAVSRETQLERYEAAMAYAGWSIRKQFQMRRYYGRKVDLIEFILAWRDEESCEAIADRFNLESPDYVSELRAKLGLPSRGHGGPRAKGEPVSRAFLAKFGKTNAVDDPAACRRVGDAPEADLASRDGAARDGAAVPPSGEQRSAPGSAARISGDGEAR